MPYAKSLIGYIILFFSFCEGNTLYTSTRPIDGCTWDRKASCIFSFSIPDSTQTYDIYLLLKNTSTYPYQNFYLTYYLRDPDCHVLDTSLNNYWLFEAKTGKPLGKGWSWRKHHYHELILVKQHQFATAGEHSLELCQFMRVEKLQGICAIGIKVSKANTKPSS